MKNTFTRTLILLAAGAALPVVGAFAQSPAAPASTPSVSVPAAETTTTDTTTTTAQEGKHGGKMRARLAALTPEERHTLMAARRKAKEDPAVKAAEATRDTDKKGYHKAMKEAMLRADPSVGPILEKLRAERPGKKNA